MIGIMFAFVVFYPRHLTFLRCARIVLRSLEGTRSPEELVVVEVGCGAGGGSFELSKGVGTVIALDASKPLLDVASAMAKYGMLTVECPLSRGSSMTQEVTLDTGVESTRITFRQCDPMCLPAGLAGELRGFPCLIVIVEASVYRGPSREMFFVRRGRPDPTCRAQRLLTPFCFCNKLPD